MSLRSYQASLINKRYGEAEFKARSINHLHGVALRWSGSLCLSFPLCVFSWAGKYLAWRAARSVDSADKSNVEKKWGARADWTERLLAVKREMKTNGLMIVQDDATK